MTVAGQIRESSTSSMAIARKLSEGATAASRTASSGAAGVLGLDGVPSGSGLPSVLATGSPLAVFQYTLSRADRLALYRYFVSVDPFVGRAIELHAELPMSRITISNPKGPSARQNKEINRIYESMTDRLGLLRLLLDIAREYWALGDVFIWFEWDDEIKEWSQIYVLPVEYSHAVSHPFLRDEELIIFARPLVDTASIRRMTDRDLYTIAGDPDVDALMQEVENDLPKDLKEILDYGEGAPLNTDPKKGSYCFHLSRNRPPNEAYGKGLLERCVECLLRLENLKNAQMQISGRNMQPKHLIYGEALSKPELDDLRSQVDLALLENVDYPIVTNYAVHWEVITGNDRLLNVETEYQTLREDLATGLGTTKELLTGAATYTGQRITLEMMNTQYLMFREVIRDFVERGIFRPVADAKGHYYYEEIDIWVECKPEDLVPGDEVIQEHDGQLRRKQIQTNKVYNHSRLRFNRLSIRDNTEVFDQLFQLHQKGSLALEYLLDLHNIDPDENSVHLLEDLATVRDPTFNRLVEGVYQICAEGIASQTNIVDKIIKGMNLDRVSQLQGEPAPGMPTGGGGVGMPPMGGGMDMGGMPGGLPGEMPPEMGMPGEMPLGGGAPAPGQSAALPGGIGTVTSSRKQEDGEPLIPGKRLSSKQVKALLDATKKASLKKKILSKRLVKSIIAKVK